MLPFLHTSFAILSQTFSQTVLGENFVNQIEKQCGWWTAFAVKDVVSYTTQPTCPCLIILKALMAKCMSTG